MTNEPTREAKTLVIFGPEIWDAQKFGGISKYYSELILRLSKRPNLTVKVAAYSDDNSEFGKLMRNLDINLIQKDELKRFLKLEKANFAGVTIYHSTYYNFRNLLKATFLGFKTVITVYDFVSEIFPEKAKRIRRPRFNQKKWCLKIADKIISISRTTTDDMVKIYNSDKDKISTIYLASGMNTVEDAVPLSYASDYFLYVGKRSGYKNFDVIMQAIKLLKDKGFSASLLAYGGGELETDLKLRIDSMGLSDSVIFMSDTSANLVDLYANARAFIYPSLYEGFGIPILDAMICRCPVIGSDIPSTREIGQSNIRYFDPSSPGALAIIMQDFIEGSGPDMANLNMARQHASTYSWDETARLSEILYLTMTPLKL